MCCIVDWRKSKGVSPAAGVCIAMLRREIDLSIILSTHNRPIKLKCVLQALARLDYSRKHFEVIVVDDGSTLPFTEVLALFDSLCH
jgi:cellulose synthase/poly-beta-1,6-N-acetylglucosamine synthase-like glycosyltransferase